MHLTANEPFMSTRPSELTDRAVSLCGLSITLADATFAPDSDTCALCRATYGVTQALRGPLAELRNTVQELSLTVRDTAAQRFPKPETPPAVGGQRIPEVQPTKRGWFGR